MPLGPFRVCWREWNRIDFACSSGSGVGEGSATLLYLSCGMEGLQRWHVGMYPGNALESNCPVCKRRILLPHWFLRSSMFPVYSCTTAGRWGGSIILIGDDQVREICSLSRRRTEHPRSKPRARAIVREELRRPSPGEMERMWKCTGQTLQNPKKKIIQIPKNTNHVFNQWQSSTNNKLPECLEGTWANVTLVRFVRPKKKISSNISQ